MRRLIYILLTILTAMLNCSAMDVTFSGATPQFHYYGKDHLGNNRVVVNASGTVEQVNHYYPFGGLMGESTNGDIQRYKYNGKELDRMNGLDWYDYGARHMDGIRFTTIDPMAEKYYGVSPYVYCKDNPIKYLDPNGLDGLISIYGNNIKISANIYLYGTGATKYVLQQMQNDVDKVWGKDHSIEHEGTTYNVSFDILGLPDQYTDKDGPNKGWENNIMGDSKNGKLDNRNINDILKDVWKEYSKWLNEGNKGIFRYEINP